MSLSNPPKETPKEQKPQSKPSTQEYVRLWNELAKHHTHVPMLNIENYPPSTSTPQSNKEK